MTIVIKHGNQKILFHGDPLRPAQLRVITMSISLIPMNGMMIPPTP